MWPSLWPVQCFHLTSDHFSGGDGAAVEGVKVAHMAESALQGLLREMAVVAVVVAKGGELPHLTMTV